MRILALIGMVFGWLVYSSMAGWAACPMCDGMEKATSVTMANTHHEMSDMAMPEIGAKDSGAQHPCSSADMTHMACGACLILPPVVSIHATGKAVFGYPRPELSQALHEKRPAPSAPPPRLA